MNAFQCRYSDRDLDIQIRIDNLQQKVHVFKYPLSWYESLTDGQIKAMHTSALVEYAQSLETKNNRTGS
jgi:hypothetical protein